MNYCHTPPSKLRLPSLLILMLGAILLPSRPAAADKSRVQSVRVGADRLVVIALRVGEIHLNGTFATRSGHSLEFDDGKLVAATDADKHSRRVESVKVDASGKLVLGSAKDEWQLVDGDYARQGGQDPRPEPEPQPRPNPNSFKVEKGELVEVTY